MILFYKLDEDKNPVPTEDMRDWAIWRCSHDTRVARSELPDFVVSTVFLCVDLSVRPGDTPLLFETMIFRLSRPGSEKFMRCHTWKEAQVIHNKVVALLSKVAARASKEGRP
jgi:hypothetical protein